VCNRSDRVAFQGFSSYGFKVVWLSVQYSKEYKGGLVKCVNRSEQSGIWVTCVWCVLSGWCIELVLWVRASRV